MNAIVTDPARGEPLLLQWTIMGSPIEELPMTLNGEARTDLPFPVRHGTKASPTSTVTIPQPENPLADQAIMTIPL
jgi:hypothetical protein